MALTRIGSLRPYTSPNLGTKRQLTVQPAKYMEPINPILIESTPRNVQRVLRFTFEVEHFNPVVKGPSGGPINRGLWVLAFVILIAILLRDTLRANIGRV